MKFGYLALCVSGAVLAGCAAQPAPTGPVGYLYHDANHPNDVTAASPQAIYNAQHGVWLWGPGINDSMKKGG